MQADRAIEFPEKLQPLFQPARTKVIFGGRGKGASWGIARALILRAWEKRTRVLCTREVQRTIKESVHQLLCDQIKLLGLEGSFEILHNEIRGPNGSMFSFTGLRDQTARNIKSYEGYDVVWVAEAEAMSRNSWNILIPTIRTEGSEIWVDFNPQLDSDETYVRFVVNTPPDCILIPMSYRDNPWFPEVLERERLHMQKTDPDEYENVWEGKPRAAVAGAIYAREITDAIENKRIRALPYDPLLKVHTVWDLGWNDRMSIIFVQRQLSELRIVDFLEDQFKTYDWYVAEINAKRYNLGKAFLPHDAAAGSAQTGMSAYQILRKLGMNCHPPLKRADVEEGIKAVRLTFPRIFFDEVKAKELVEHLRRYRRNIPVTHGEPTTPMHDEHSHAADALRYLVQAAEHMRNDEKMAPLPVAKTGIL